MDQEDRGSEEKYQREQELAAAKGFFQLVKMAEEKLALKRKPAMHLVARLSEGGIVLGYIENLRDDIEQIAKIMEATHLPAEYAEKLFFTPSERVPKKIVVSPERIAIIEIVLAANNVKIEKPPTL